MTPIDIRPYFPDAATVTLNKSSGSASARYLFKKAPSGIDSLYYGYMSLGKAGYPYQWGKQYWRNGAWCTETYAALFMGDDLSVTEVGDWTAGTPCTPDRAMGYMAPGTYNHSGLEWSGPGGLSDTPVVKEVDVWKQATVGAAITNTGVKSYSRTGVIEKLATFTPAYGRDVNGVWGAGLSKTYTDVVHIVMYHGTKTPNVAPVRCVGPISANGVYYQSYKDYSSYAIELWLAAGVGVIQENCPFIEDATAWGGAISNCGGDIFASPVGSWITYIDQI